MNPLTRKLGPVPIWQSCTGSTGSTGSTGWNLVSVGLTTGLWLMFAGAVGLMPTQAQGQTPPECRPFADSNAPIQALLKYGKRASLLVLDTTLFGKRLFDLEDKDWKNMGMLSEKCGAPKGLTIDRVEALQGIVAALKADWQKHNAWVVETEQRLAEMPIDRRSLIELHELWDALMKREQVLRREEMYRLAQKIINRQHAVYASAPMPATPATASVSPLDWNASTPARSSGDRPSTSADTTTLASATADSREGRDADPAVAGDLLYPEDGDWESSEWSDLSDDESRNANNRATPMVDPAPGGAWNLRVK